MEINVPHSGGSHIYKTNDKWGVLVGCLLTMGMVSMVFESSPWTSYHGKIYL